MSGAVLALSLAALLRSDSSPLEILLLEASVPEQHTHSGFDARAIALSAERGVRRAMLLPVSAPFHCALMQPAAEAMRAALAEIAMGAPCVPVMANVGAAPLSDPDAIRASLVAQVTGTVRWRECVAAMAAAGVTDFVEAGSGKVLAGLVKRIAAGAATASVGTAEDIATYKSRNG